MLQLAFRSGCHPLIAGASVVALLVASAAPAGAQQDRVRLAGGGAEVGRVSAVSPEGVKLQTRDGAETIAIDRVDSVLFAGEPPGLTQARLNATNGGFATALERLAEVPLRSVENELVRVELRFHRAYCEARLAIVGSRDAVAAGKRLTAFLREHRDSYHTYRAIETLGDLLVSLKRYDRAGATYARLADSSTPAVQLRASVLRGRAAAAAGDAAEAIQRFDEVLAAQADGPAVEAERLAAKLGKAAALAADGRLEEGLTLAREVVTDAGEDDDTLRAAGYNTLGRCYEAAGKPTDALLAYLHTDLLFDRDPETHAEALARLAVLWRRAGEPAEADEARARLRREYAGSRWASDAG